MAGWIQNADGSWTSQAYRDDQDALKKQQEKTTMTNNRLKQRALSRNKLASFTQGTTLARPTVGQKKDSMSLFDVNTDMPSLLGDF